MLESVIEILKSMMGLLPIDKITGMDFFNFAPMEFGLIVIFLVFLVIAYKIFRMVVKVIGVGIIAAIFPVAGNYLFGLAIPITFQTLISYFLIGMLVAFIYLVVDGIYKIVSWPFKGKPKQRTIVKYIKKDEKKK